MFDLPTLFDLHLMYFQYACTELLVRSSNSQSISQLPPLLCISKTSTQYDEHIKQFQFTQMYVYFHTVSYLVARWQHFLRNFSRILCNVTVILKISSRVGRYAPLAIVALDPVGRPSLPIPSIIYHGLISQQDF